MILLLLLALFVGLCIYTLFFGYPPIEFGVVVISFLLGCLVKGVYDEYNI